ncbi:MAG: GcrA cell cycle regulator [Acetobacteraceae bacterium]|nr:GcrA cell cycle regulator [Acetobacteraceae bacterium]
MNTARTGGDPGKTCPESSTGQNRAANKLGGSRVHHTPVGFNWTSTAIQQLRSLWAEGLSAAEIARRLGASKNAVLGKVHRLHLPKRDSPIRRAATAGGTRRKRPIVPKLRDIIPMKSVSAPVTPAMLPTPAPSFARTGKTPCCWPIGEPGTPGFRFCDALAVTGRPYCQQHCAVAYRRPTTDEMNEHTA